MVRLLSFDMATVTGFCVGDGVGLPTVGHIVLPAPIKGNRGPMFTTFRCWVIGLIRKFLPHRIIGEAAIMPKPFIKNGKLIFPTRLEVTLILQGLWAILEQVCDELGIPCDQVDNGTAKKELAGFGGAEKLDMVKAAKKVGLEIAVHDEADAFSIWLVAIREYAERPIRDDWDRRVWSTRGALI